MKILDEINESLKRIALALEKQNGIESIPSLPSKKATEPILFDSNSKLEEGDPLSFLSIDDKKELEKQLSIGRSGGFLFEEDAVNREYLEKM